MVSTLQIVLAVSVLASVACSAFAVQCYQCDSISNPKCGVDFDADDSYKFDCSKVAPPRFFQALYPVKNATGCMKTMLEGVGNQPRVMRSCYFGDVANTQTGCRTDPNAPFIRQLSCDVCTGNFCNGSTAVGPVAVAVLLFFALAKLLS